MWLHLFKLRWSELVMKGSNRGFSLNKAFVFVFYFLVLAGSELLHLPLADRGGEGKEMERLLTRGTRSGGGDSAPVRVHDIRRWSTRFSAPILLLAGHGGEGENKVGPGWGVTSLSSVAPRTCCRDSQMEPLAAGAAGASAIGASRPPSFASQTNALLRKNLIFQKRNRKASIRLIMVPIFLCVLLSVLQRVINNLLDKPEYKCGCRCVSVNGSVPCQIVCGIQYSTLDQAESCPIPNPPEWPTLLQVPRPEYRTIQDSSKKITGLPDASCRKSHSCPASIPFTGANESLSTSVMQNMFTYSPLTNLSDFTSTFSLLLGTDVPGTSTGFVESAFISSAPIYVLQSQCNPMDPVTVRTAIDAIHFQKEIKCVQGLPLWRNSSTTINEETFKGYRKGKTGEGIMEVAMDSDEKHFNVLAFYNSTYQKFSYIPRPLGLLRVSRSLNAVSNAYLQFLQGQGSGIKLLLEFTKEMPKQAIRLRIDFSSLVGPLFFEWVVALLFPVMLTYLVYEKQQKFRTMMKMHGLGNGPYWIIYYAYFLILSTVYLLLFVIFGSVIGLSFFKENDYSIQFVFFFSFINLQIVLSFLAAAFFSKVNTVSSNLAWSCN